MITLLKYWKVGAGLILVVLLIAGYAYWHHQVYQSGVDAKQLEWDADNAKRDAAQAAKDAQNVEVIRGYDKKLQVIAADRNSLAKRLHDYQISALQGARGSVETGPQSGGQATVDGRLDAYDAACRADAAQLDALIEAIQPPR